MRNLAWLAIYAAVLVTLLWPQSRSGQAVLSVTAGIGGVLRQAGGSVMGGTT